MITLLFLAMLFLAGAVVITLGMRDAPEAYEDASGFHLVWKNDAPHRRDIVCVWDSPCGLSQV